MRIVIATTYVPFTRGGDRKIVDDLESALHARGHVVEVVRIPLCSEWDEVPRQTLAIRLLDLTESCGNRIDRLITLRYPSYALRHPNKVAWFVHHHRGAYDLWSTPYGDIPNNAEGCLVRDRIIRSDNAYLREAKRIYTNSIVVADRLRLFNNLEPDGVLYPPLLKTDCFHAGEFGDYFVYPARLNLLKRQALAVEAMSHVRSPFGIVLIGTSDDPEYEQRLRDRIAALKLEHKVRLTGWISEKEKAEWLAKACGVLYLAYDEDSYGYSTLEGFHSHKPVITCTDSGGTLEVVSDGVNGMVTDPGPALLADCMERMWRQKRRAAEMGRAAFDALRLHNINWDHVTERLVA